MLKQVIKFSNGDYWYYFHGSGPNLQDAWTFNRAEGAANTIRTNELTNCRILPVIVQFEPKYIVEEFK